jgi:phosphatidylinositol alpha-1,6-mannosyltransferase
MIVVLTQCFPPAVGGIENLMGNASRQLAERGIEVVVLADGRPPAVPDPVLAGVDVRYFSGWRPLRRLAKMLALRRLLKGRRAEALFADSWKSLETLRRSGCAGACDRIVAYAHGNEYPASPKWRKRRRIEAALAVATLVLANSRFTQGRAAAFTGDPDKIRLRPPPIDPPALVSADDAAWAASVWEGQGPRLLTLCRLEPLKGIDNTLQALPALLKDHPGLRYVVAGSGDDRPRLEALASATGVSAAVRFVGTVAGGRKSALYASADLFVMPTRREGTREEGFGMVFAEAAAHGLPVVAGRSGGATDAVVDGETAVIVDGADVAAIAAAVGDLLAAPERRAAMGQAAERFGRALTWPERIAGLEVDLLAPARRG